MAGEMDQILAMLRGQQPQYGSAAGVPQPMPLPQPMPSMPQRPDMGFGSIGGGGGFNPLPPQLGSAQGGPMPSMPGRDMPMPMPQPLGPITSMPTVQGRPDMGIAGSGGNQLAGNNPAIVQQLMQLMQQRGAMPMQRPMPQPQGRTLGDIMAYAGGAPPQRRFAPGGPRLM